jgi:hypothetical protein
MTESTTATPQPARGATEAGRADDADNRLRHAQLGGALAAVAVAASESQEPSAREDPDTPRRGRRVVLVPTGSGRRARSRRDIGPARSPDTVADTSTPASDQTSADTQSELRGWMKDNATLLSNVSLLVSIAALALNLLPGESWLEPYLQALIFGAAFVLLVELQHQWPQDLQIHKVRSATVPASHSWRMSAFAFLMQVATILFVLWAVLTTPLILFPLTAIAVVMLFRRFYFRRFGGRFAGIVGVLSLVLVLLLSELLMLLTWAALTDQPVTIEFFTDERTSFDPTIERGD